MNERYIFLYEKIFKENWARKPAYLAVWIYLLLKASSNNYGTLKRGELIITNRKLAKYLDINFMQIHRIIDYYVSEKMIEKISLKNSTKIKILNYDLYQSPERTKRSGENNSSKTTGGAKKENSRSKFTPSVDDVY